MVVARYNNREATQVKVEGVKEGGMSSGRSPGDERQACDSLLRYLAIRLRAGQSGEPHHGLGEYPVSVGNGLVMRRLRPHDERVGGVLSCHRKKAGFRNTVVRKQHVPPCFGIVEIRRRVR